MSISPHFLLFSEAGEKMMQGQWRFVLQAADGSATFEASDTEPLLAGERLELLAVVRGLEALDQPSRVTLYTPSRYVNRGLTYGLDEWRRNGWSWECFGEMVPVKNRDLWQRIDRALGYHRLEFRGFRFDPPHARGGNVPAPHFTLPAAARPPDRQPAARGRGVVHRRWSRAAARLRRQLGERAKGLVLSCQQLGTCFLPRPWIG
ncbi:MAG: RNase H family protein [Pirellulales bacterium]